ncbi:MAG: hypothetical protein K2Y09_12995 [Nitrosomonas sp.]|jgi:hypothetical protein|uniref:hypothetical protein n=1 Tax=Nitrosomonas sp. TaxID=42353 RepID=UPI001DACDDDE|nr:hypothetical protein [Nitrosomonas sp.]MBX9896070.1 hypothetical protein [Nitrosomonas sp.]
MTEFVGETQNSMNAKPEAGDEYLVSISWGSAKLIFVTDRFIRESRNFNDNESENIFHH